MTLPKSDRVGRCQFHVWRLVMLRDEWRWDECETCRKRRKVRATKPTPKKRPLKRGRGFGASPAQREKVRGMACVACGVMASESVAIDPAHICSQGMGGCDDPMCVIPLCRSAFSERCHGRFDKGELDIDKFLEPRFRAEVAHAVTHLGLEGTRRRLCPSEYVKARAA